MDLLFSFFAEGYTSIICAPMLSVCGLSGMSRFVSLVYDLATYDSYVCTILQF